MATPDHAPPPRACNCDTDPGVFGHMSFDCEHTMFPDWVTGRVHAGRAHHRDRAEAAIARGGEVTDISDVPAATELATVLGSGFDLFRPAAKPPRQGQPS